MQFNLQSLKNAYFRFSSSPKSRTLRRLKNPAQRDTGNGKKGFLSNISIYYLNFKIINLSQSGKKIMVKNKFGFQW